MQFTMSEMIQIMRRRSGMNQAELGVKAFGLNPNSARTKIKNIELGLQLVTAEEAQTLAAALGVDAAELSPSNATRTDQNHCGFAPQTVKIFPGLEAYVDMLNNAVRLGDQDLVGFIAAKLSTLFAENYKRNAGGRT